MATDFRTGIEINRQVCSIISLMWFASGLQNASIDDLESAISRCKELVMSTDECSFERKWLGKLVICNL